jgi:ERCC4-type nuclease
MDPAEKGADGVSARNVVVVVDDREQHAGVVVALRQISGIDVRVERLKSGDYIVEDQCVFERKTLQDFAASIVDGRLFRQSRRLVNACPFSALILEGRTRDLSACQISREALQGAMVSLSLIYRLPILRSFDPVETAHLLVYAGRQMQQHDGVVGFRAGRRPKSRRRRQLHVLQALPGLGPERASSLLETFGTVQAVMTANLEALQVVKGIGAKTAAGIRDVLREQPRPYGSAAPDYPFFSSWM